MFAFFLLFFSSLSFCFSYFFLTYFLFLSLSFKHSYSLTYTTIILALKKTGVLNSVKAHIRKEFINNISNKKSNVKTLNNSLKIRIVISLIYHFLKLNGLNHTLSVLVAECGYESVGFLSEIDLMESLKLNNYHSNTNNQSLNVRRSHNYHNFNLHEDEVESVLEKLVEISSKLEKHCIDASIQTDLAGPGIREVLDNQIKELHLSYLTRRETERLLPNKTIEERMLSYQRECEERLKKEYDSQVLFYHVIIILLLFFIILLLFQLIMQYTIVKSYS